MFKLIKRFLDKRYINKLDYAMLDKVTKGKKKERKTEYIKDYGWIIKK